MRTPLQLAGAALVALLFAACGPRIGDSRSTTPLFDLDHAADVLQEASALAQPPSDSGNRLLKGWWPRRTEHGLRLQPNPKGVSIEITQLVDRKREISLYFDFDPEFAGQPVRTRIGGLPEAEIPLASPFKLTIPAGLRRGRIPIELVFPEPSGALFTGSELHRPAPAGRVELGRETIRQAGTSQIELTRYVPAGSRISGSLEPPTNAQAGQLFELRLETQSGAEETLVQFETGDPSEPLTFTEEIDSEGPVRVKLYAAGEGLPATWRGLELHTPTPPRGEIAPTAGVETAGDRAPSPLRLVLVYVLDALRADALGSHGADPESSPFIDRLAREGVRFANHQTVAPNTLPSTKAFFSGRTPMLQGNWKLSEEPTTLAEEFAAGGFRTAAFSGNEFISPEFGTARGFEFVDRDALFEDYAADPERFNDNAVAVHRTALDWLSQLETDEKAFVYLHTIHPHQPYDPPKEFAPPVGPESSIDGSSRTLLDIKHVRHRPSEGDRERLKALYRGALQYNDREFEGLVGSLLESYAPSEILIVVTADHGEELFDHGGVLHGYTLFDEQLAVPLILWSPEFLDPTTVTEPTHNVALAEQLRAIANGSAPSSAVERLAASGASSSFGPPVRFAAASSVDGGIFMARSERYKVIWAPRAGTQWGSGQGAGRSRSVEYVFDLREDPQEFENLAGTDELEVAWLRSRLMAWIAFETAREEAGELPTIDAEAEARLKALGYLD